MGRLDLNLAGRRGTKFQSNLTFILLCTVAIFVFYFGTDCMNSFAENKYIHSDSSPQNQQWWMNVLLPSSVLTLFLFYLIVVTRRYIRKRDNIAPRCCGGCDDCCAAAFFPSCAISQMMRHTADYSVYRAVWLSKTGLPDGVVVASSEQQQEREISERHFADNVV
jgi:PLAC8 family.